MTGAIRATLVLAGFIGLTLPLMPLQWALIRLGSDGQNHFPHWYHRQLCRLLGIRLHQQGEIRDDQAVLVISNHVTWLDIPILSAVAPVSFVAKKEVASWPLAGSLARLQRTVFVDRGSRTAVGATSSEMTARLQAGDHVVLFAEGTSSDGNRVLPFKTSLFAAAKPGRNANGKSGSKSGGNSDPTEDNAGQPIFVQTIALTYSGIHGLPLTRLTRPFVAWYGDMEMTSHAWSLLKAGPIDVHIKVGAPVPLADFAGRKDLAQFAENEIRSGVVRRLRGRPGDDALQVTKPPKSWSRRDPGTSSVGSSATWV